MRTVQFPVVRSLTHCFGSRIGRLPKTTRKKKPNESLISEATASLKSGGESDERSDFNATSVTGGRLLPASVNTPQKRKATATLQDTTNRSANSADNDGSELNFTKRNRRLRLEKHLIRLEGNLPVMMTVALHCLD